MALWLFHKKGKKRLNFIAVLFYKLFNIFLEYTFLPMLIK
jgi:hypothetical protein